jgi:hypothetical protein
MSTVTETWSTPHGLGFTTSWNGDQTWTIFGPTANICEVVSNAACCLGDDGVTVRAYGRNETALSTADHEAQVTIGPISSDGGGAMDVGTVVRFDPTTNACYMGWADLATQVTDVATSWFPVAAGGTKISTIGRGGWRGTWRGVNRGSR